jgi:hypothetical protein
MIRTANGKEAKILLSELGSNDFLSSDATMLMKSGLFETL